MISLNLFLLSHQNSNNMIFYKINSYFNLIIFDNIINKQKSSDISSYEKMK